MPYTLINKSTDHFKPKIYTGTGSSQTISGVGFQPDFTWIKLLSGSDSHSLQDVVRGANKHLRSDTTAAEAESGTAHITSWNSDGFVLGSGDGQVNANSSSYVSWNWKTQNSQGSSNTDGSINTTYTSVNTTAGFSICKWAGSGANATIGHGLGAVPKMIITKSLATSSWCVYHASLGNTKTIFLESAGTPYANVAYYNNTSPTSSVFSVGPDDAVNHSGNNMIAYCFAEKEGYSKFGTYTGNGNADGTFIYLGFKPAFILVKSTNTSTEWHMSDTARRPNNPNNSYVSAASNAAENTGNPTDFLSNGVKIKTSNNGWNKSGDTFIYWAIAEAPLVGSNDVPATAR